MSTITRNGITSTDNNNDLAITGLGSGVPNLEAGYKVNGTVEKLTGIAPSTSGNVLTSDGTNWTSAAGASGGAFTSTQVFDAGSGTWSRPSGITTIIVEMVGGGGGGGGATSNFACCGAAGAYAQFVLDVTNISSAPLVVGAAGAKGSGASSGTNGAAGGNSTFGNSPVYCQTNGGGGGLKSSNTALSLGGEFAFDSAVSAANRLVSMKGQLGSGGGNPDQGGQGNAGSGPLGSGAVMPGAGAASGRDGSGYGAGGSGGCLTAANGGDGAPGRIIVYEYT